MANGNKAKKEEVKDVAVKAGTMPANPGAFAGQQASGFEDARRENYALPFITILQSLSPQVADGLEGAKPGRFLNTVTQEIADELIVIPCRYTNTIVEWVPRDAGGGFRGEAPYMERKEEFEQARDPKTGKAKLANGNELADTHNFYVLVEDQETGAVSPAIISMGSTQIKKARTWLSFMRMKTMPGANGSMFVPAMYASRFKLTTRQESNSKGKWFGWAYEWLGFMASPEVPAYQQAITFSESVKQGNVKVDRSQLETPGAETEQPEEM
jgi:hypothetical protein